ncbi:MAG: HAD family hydrolase [Desulfobacterales bacterium]|jgi:HAD superfamily hydrolase (TIGR01509 family)
MSDKQKKLKVAAVIFDLDGTLIDSIDIYFMIVEKALERLNLPGVSRSRILAAAESEEFKWELILPADTIKRKEEIVDEAWAVINEIAPQMFADNLELIPGAAGIVENLSSNGLKIGLVTSTQRKYLETKMQPLKIGGVDTLFEVIITSDDVEKRKPAPDPLIICAQQLDVKPGNCVYVGDTTTDIKAGKAAGMLTIGVLTGFDEYEALEREKPDAIVENIQNLQEVIEV